MKDPIQRLVLEVIRDLEFKDRAEKERLTVIGDERIVLLQLISSLEVW